VLRGSFCPILNSSFHSNEILHSFRLLLFFEYRHNVPCRFIPPFITHMTMKPSKPRTLKQTPRSIQKTAKHSIQHKMTKLPCSSCSSSSTGTSSTCSSSTGETLLQRPALLVQSLFQAVGASIQQPSGGISKPTDEDMASYDLQIVIAMRTQNLPELRRLHSEEGKSLNACNQFGESLIHMACRRGNIDIVRFMVLEAKVRVDIRDDFGRNPLHDACWTTSPNFDVMDVLLQVAHPNLLIAEDVRGSSPFDYARREHFKKWRGYLESRKDLILHRIKLSMCEESSSISG
jgi:hypothetical protein